MNDPFYSLYSHIHNTALSQNFKIQKVIFPDLGCSNPLLLKKINDIESFYEILTYKNLIFHDQEPIAFTSFKNNWEEQIAILNKLETNHILSNSEVNSIEKDLLLAESGWHDFYWFSNGFLSLEWYRFYQYAAYLEQSWEPKNYFSSYNRILKGRDHRLIIAKHLYNNHNDKIILSCHSDNNSENIFIKTENKVSENLSFTIDVKDFIDSFCHIVTERIYYEDRIHLTEKVFRPLICCRPFILVSSPYALKYLKGYGFKTFNDFWSEDYDNIENHNDRLNEILRVIDYIGSMGHKQILEMLNSMKEILIYNRNHFYYEFRNIITKELFNNLNHALSLKSDQRSYFFQIINNLSKKEYELLRDWQEFDSDDDMARKVFLKAVHLKKATSEDQVRLFVQNNLSYFKHYYEYATKSKQGN